MIFDRAETGEVVLGNWLHWLRTREIVTRLWREGLFATRSFSEDLTTDLTPQYLAQWRRNRISDLASS
jgi:hypothetical protein